MKRIGIDARKIGDFGIGTYIRSLLEKYPELGSGYRFVLFGPPVRLREIFGAQFEIVPCTARAYSIAEQWQLPRLIRARKLDLFHSPHYVVPVATSCPLVVTIHDLIHLQRDVRPGFKHRLAAIYARRLISLAVAKARRVITVSKYSLSDIARHFPAAAGKTVAIYNGIHPRESRPFSEAELAQFRADKALARPLVLFVGNPLPHKNLRRVLDAVADAAQKGCPVSLALAGCKPEALARFRDVPPRVSALGFVSEEDLQKLYHAADLLLFPSLYEGFGLTILEAMTAGLPVVTSGVSSMPEIAGDAAVIVDPRDHRAIADAMISTLGQAELRDDLIARGHARVREFSWETSAKEHLAVYDRALQTG